MDKSRKIILVRGGCGFIGSNLIEKLVQYLSNTVLCVDNLITGLESNIQEYLSRSNLRYMRWDICDPIDGLVQFIGPKLANPDLSFGFPS